MTTDEGRYGYDSVCQMRFQLLRKKLDYRMEIDHNWSLNTGAYGKGLKKLLFPEIWSDLERTYIGAGEKETRVRYIG